MVGTKNDPHQYHIEDYSIMATDHIIVILLPLRRGFTKEYSNLIQSFLKNNLESTFLFI